MVPKYEMIRCLKMCTLLSIAFIYDQFIDDQLLKCGYFLKYCDISNKVLLRMESFTERQITYCSMDFFKNHFQIYSKQ